MKKQPETCTRYWMRKYVQSQKWLLVTMIFFLASICLNILQFAGVNYD